MGDFCVQVQHIKMQSVYHPQGPSQPLSSRSPSDQGPDLSLMALSSLEGSVTGARSPGPSGSYHPPVRPRRPVAGFGASGLGDSERGLRTGTVGPYHMVMGFSALLGLLGARGLSLSHLAPRGPESALWPGSSTR